MWGEERTQDAAYTADRSNGATVLELGVGHSLYILQNLLGNFKSLSATTATIIETTKIRETGEILPSTDEDHIALSGVLDTGVFASVSLRAGCTPVTGHRVVWDIQGTKGLIRMVDPKTEGSFAWMALNDFEIYLNGELIYPGGGGLATNVSKGWEEFAKVEGEGHYPTLEDAVKTHELIDAIRTSALEGVRVEL